MTIPDDDEFEASFDDFDFEDDFEDVWDDDVSQPEIEDTPENDKPPSDPIIKGDEKLKKDIAKPIKSSSHRAYIVPVLAVTVLGAAGYYAYLNFNPVSPSLPVVQISSVSNSSLKGMPESFTVQEDIQTPSFENQNIEISPSPIAPSVEDSTPKDATNNLQDDVLTPLPEDIEDFDIALDPLIPETVTASSDKGLSARTNMEESENVSKAFDEQKMLDKTELSPSDDTLASDGDNPDIFDQIESLREAGSPTDNSFNNAAETEGTVKPISAPPLPLPVETTSKEEMDIVKAEKSDNEKPIGPKDIISKRKPSIEKTMSALEQSNTKPVKKQKKNWKIKAVQPGKAVIRDPASGAIKSVEVGHSVYEIGRIKEITKKSGKWVIVGELGRISQ